MRDQKPLTYWLNKLWATVIEAIDVDLCSHVITFELTAIEQGQSERYSLIFDGVSSFQFVTDPGDTRFYKPRWDYAELSAIHYYKNAVDRIAHQRPARQGEVKESTAFANFVLEIWSSTLFIEAHTITINHNRFEVGYPSNIAATTPG